MRTCVTGAVLIVVVLMAAFTPHSSSSARRVAVIGGGISGLACGRRLQQLGIDATIFDTGKREVGGRCSSRVVEVNKKQVVLDHSAQYFTAASDLFHADVVRPLLDKHAIVKWDGPIVRVGPSAPATPVAMPDVKPRYAGAEGMASVARALAEGLDVQRPVWVSQLERDGTGWRLWHYADCLGTFDAVVVAHNGKCAGK